MSIGNFGGGGGGGGTPSSNRFMVTFTGALAQTDIPSMLSLTNKSAGLDAFFGETDKGGPVDNKGGIIEPTGNTWPAVPAPAAYTIPLRTPFVMTGSADDAEGDSMLFSWEQNDRGGSAGTSLLSNTKTNGALFAMFPKSGQITLADALEYNSPGQNHLTTDPVRVFPDLQQILDNNTNADTGACPMGPVANPVPQDITECYAEFLPTVDYVGYSGGGTNNASPLSLHFRFTARDGRGGVASADTTLLLANNAGPFLVTSPNTAVTLKGTSVQTITWDPANTNIAPVNASDVKISLSTDGGYTYPYVLAATTPNDGSEAVMLPNVSTTTARVKIEGVSNIFFDLSNSDFEIQAVADVSGSLGEGGSQAVQYSDSLAPDVTITASHQDSLGVNLSVAAVGLPAGMSLELTSTTDDATLPGVRTWRVIGATTAAPGSYPVTVSVTDELGGVGTTAFTIVVTPEDAEATHNGDMVAFTPYGGSVANVLLRAVVRDSSVVPSYGDALPGDIRNATVTFKEGATVLCGPLAVELINGETTTGAANCIASLAVGVHQVDVYVNNYYTGMASALIEIAQPAGNSATGDGYLTIGTSGGAYKANPGSKMDFGFSTGYKNNKSLWGQVYLIFKKDGKTYQVKGAAFDSFGIATGPDGKVSDFRARVTLSDATNPKTPIVVGSNLTLQATMTDKGEPGTSDMIGFTIWDGNKLVFSSEWTGAKTLEMLVKGGNLVVN